MAEVSTDTRRLQSNPSASTGLSAASTSSEAHGEAEATSRSHVQFSRGCGHVMY